MISNAGMLAARRLTLTVICAALSALGGSAAAAPTCRPVHGRFDIAPVEDCQSPVGVCGQGRFSGGLRGSYNSQFLTIAGSEETAQTGVVLFTAEATVDARVGGWSGSLTFKESGAFRTTGGEFAELFSVVAGSGDFVGASGVLTSTGSVDATLHGGGEYDGFVCVG